MNMKIFIFLMGICFFLAGEVTEQDGLVVLQGKRYRLDLRKNGGSIAELKLDGKRVSLGSSGSWHAVFEDRSIVYAAAAENTGMAIQGNRVAFTYDHPEISVVVSLTAGDDFVDFQAEARPKNKVMIAFGAPGKLEFEPGSINGVICHLPRPTNCGVRLNADFFRDQSNQRGERLAWDRTPIHNEACRVIFGHPALNLGGDANSALPPAALEAGPQSAEWLDAETRERALKMLFNASRPFGKGQLEIEILNDSGRGNVAFGGSRLGGKGAIFHFGGWGRDPQTRKLIGEIYLSMLDKMVKDNRLPEERRKIALILTGISPAAAIPDAGFWTAALKKYGDKVVLITSPAEMAKCIDDPAIGVIINPYTEFCVTPPDTGLVEFASSIRKFVQGGGYWFGTGGSPFYYQLTPRKYLQSGPAASPGAVADICHFEQKNGQFSIYSVQPVTWKPFDRERIFIPSYYELGGSGRGGFLERSFHIYVKPGENAAMPLTRLLLNGSDIFAALKQFAADNGVSKKLDDKGTPELREKVKQSLLFYPWGDMDHRAENIIRALPLLPSPMIIHSTEYLYGGFDKQYPDHLPPPVKWGTMDDFRQVLKAVRENGMLFMPYTNNTWWSDHPRGPTFVEAGEAPLQINEAGRKIHEVYGRNDGWSICMWHPAVRAASDKILRQFTEELKVDILFQDQSGARGVHSFDPKRKPTDKGDTSRIHSGYDLNPAGPHPNSPVEGLMSTVRHDAASALLATEEGWWGLLDYEFMTCGHSGGIVRFSAWMENFFAKYPRHAMELFPLVQGLGHERVVMTPHDLAGAVRDARTLAWTFVLGQSIVTRGDPFKADQLELIKWMDRQQKSAAARYIGKGVRHFKHENTGDGDGVIRAGYGSAEVVANFRRASLREGDIELPENGYLFRDGEVLGGLIAAVNDNRCLTWFLIDGNTAYVFGAGGTPAMLPLELAGVTLDGEFTVNNGATLFKLPETAEKYRKVWKFGITRK